PAAAALCLAVAHALGAEPSALPLLEQLARSLGLAADHAEVLAALAKAEPDRSLRVEWCQRLGDALEQLGRHAEAAEAFAQGHDDAAAGQEAVLLAGRARCLEATRGYRELLDVTWAQLEVEQAPA